MELIHENIVRIKAVANLMKGLGQPYVFVGGATVSLYASEPVFAEGIRPTEDVDVVIELLSYKGYTEIDERLRKIGFVNDIESGIICRYKIEGIIVDVMPTTAGVIGFSNRWYPEGFSNAIVYKLNDNAEILIFSLPYFLASKWDAHKSRGGNDLRMSKDFEDMVYVFENCRDFEEQLLAGPDHVRNYLSEEFLELIDHPDFEEAVYCHMEGGKYGANPSDIIIRLKKGLNLNQKIK
jgi:predicted nucleotidyltransferase